MKFHYCLLIAALPLLQADIMTWLKLIGLDQYIPNFLDEGFDDMEFVQDLTVEDLERIEIKKPGHRRKLWMSSSALREADDGNDSGFETNRESSHVQETSFNGNMKPFLETDLDALTKQMGDRHDMNTAPLESAPQENAETNSLLNADDAEDETKIVDAGEEKFGVSSTLVEENEPDLDSILAQVGDESTEYENVPTLQTEKNSEVDSEEKTIGDDKIEQETAVSSPDSRQEPPVDHVSPACESHVQPSLPEPSDHVEQTMTEPSSHVDSSVPTLPDAAKAQTSKKPSPPPVRPKPRSRTGSHDILDQISAPSEISKDKPPSPPVKPKPRVEPPQTKENVKEIAGKFVPTPSGGVSTSPPPVRPKSFKRDPPHIPPNPLNSDPIPRASSFSYYGKTQHQVRDVARGRSGSESKWTNLVYTADAQTDIEGKKKQADRLTDRQTERQTDRDKRYITKEKQVKDYTTHTHIHTHTHTYTYTYIHTHIHIHTHTHTHTHSERQKDI